MEEAKMSEIALLAECVKTGKVPSMYIIEWAYKEILRLRQVEQDVRELDFLAESLHERWFQLVRQRGFGSLHHEGVSVEEGK